MGAIADRVKLSFQQEVTFGVNPGNAFNELRITSESLSKVTDTTQSTEIRSDQQVVDLVRNGIRANGGFDFEFSYGALDTLIAAVLFSADFPAASTLVDVDGNNAISIVAATGTITDDAAGGLFATVTAGQWLELSNFVNTANNVLVKVLSKTDNDNIVVAGLKALVDETRAASAVDANAKIVIGSQVTNGTTQRSFTFEKHFTDLSPEQFAVFLGMVAQSLQLNVSADSIITGSMAFLGKDESALAGATSGSSQNAAPTNSVMNAIDNVLGIIEGTPVVDTDNEFGATSFSMSIENNLRERLVIGTLGAESIGAGKIAVTGTLQAFFASQSAADKYLAFTRTGLSVLFQDEDGNRYVIELPRLRFSQGTKVAGGENSDILLDLNFTAFRHETEGVTIRIARFPSS